ncbi:MAG: hypothetical protein ACLFQK_10135 [Fibrobacterota bacterium]
METFISAYSEHPVVYSIILLMLIAIVAGLVKIALKAAVLFFIISAALFIGMVLKDDGEREKIKDYVKEKGVEVRKKVEPGIEKIGNDMGEKVKQAGEGLKSKIKENIDK